MNQNIYGIGYKDGGFVKLAGKNFSEAYAQNGRKTADGNIDFSILDFYIRVPSPVIQQNKDQYMLFLMRDKKSDWEPTGELINSFSECEGLMKLKVKLEGFFSGIVVDMNSEKVLSWIWTK
jgi:hypothetical protein